MEDGAAAAAKERESGDSAMAAANRLAGGADGEPRESEDVSRVLEENEVFEEAMETPRHLLPESDDGAASRVENGAGSVGPIALVVGDKNLEKEEEEMVGLEKFVDSTDAVVHDQKPNEQEIVGFEKFVTEEGMAASDEVGCAHREGEDEEESVPIKSNSAVLDSEAGAGLCEVINGSVGNGNKAFAGKKSDNEELERVKSDGPDDLLHGRAENGERLEVTYSECGVDNDAESNEQVAPRRGIQQLKDVSVQSVALSEDPAKFQQPKENSAELDNGFAATNGHASVEREDGGFATNGHASVEKVGSSCSHVINAANDYLKENKADMHETTKKLQKESFENLGHSSSTSNDNKKSSSSLASPSTSNPENLGSHGLSSHPAGLGSSASLLEPSARSLQQTRANGSGPRRVSQPLEELPNDDGEENDEVREKLQMIRVKFLRLAHRLGQTPHNVVVAQVLYRLGLAEQLKRNTNRPGVFSFDRASDVAEQLEAAGQETLDFSCTIMVIGKTGVGKSSTINSIFDEVKLPTDAFQMGTKKVQEVVGMVQGIKVRVIDMPGLVSSSSDQHRNEKTLHSVKRFINKNPPDIVLYFDRLDMQSRDYGDAPLLQTITDIFGVSIWFNAIVVLTHAASAPPDGPNGSPLSYETFVTQRSHLVQQAIRQAAGDVRLMNPVSLVENHSGCRMNRAGQRVLPNGQVWKPQLLLLSFASKILAEANMLLKLQDSPGKPFGSRPRVPPLPFLLSSLLQSRPQLKLPEEQFGDDDNLDEDLDETSDSDEGSDYDDLPPFKYLTKSHVAKLSKAQKKAYFEELDYRERLFYKKQLKEEKRRRKLMKKMADMAKDMPDEHNNEDVEEETSGPASVPEPMPDFVLPNSFDSDNPTHRYRVLDSSNQWLVRPVLDSQGWDHDIGYEGLNVERVFVIKDKIPLSVSGQFTKDKKECTLQMEVASSIKHSESKATSLCLDTHTVGKDIAYTLRGETRFRNFRCNNSSAGVSVTVLGDSMSAGLKFEDKLMISKRLGVLMSGGAMAGRGDVAYGGRLEATLRDKDYPIGRALSTLALSIVDWHGDIALGCNIQSQFPLGRGTNLIGHANLSNKGTGQFGIRLNSSEHLQVAVLALVPILRNVNRIFFGSSQSM